MASVTTQIPVGRVLAQAQAFFFDFDGVFVDANGVKIEALEQALFDMNVNNNDIERCSHFFKENFGRGRFVHFHHFYHHILTSPLPEASFIARLDAAYQANYRANYTPSLITDGAVEAVTYLNRMHVPLYIVTGGDGVFVEQFLRECALLDCFDAVLGAPENKVTHLNSILSACHYSADKCWFIGDSLVDKHSAAAVGMPFIFIKNYSIANYLEQETDQSLAQLMNADLVVETLDHLLKEIELAA